MAGKKLTEGRRRGSRGPDLHGSASGWRDLGRTAARWLRCKSRELRWPEFNWEVLLSLLAFAVVSALSFMVVSTEQDRLAQNQRTDVSYAVLRLKSRLESELNANAFLANGMVAHIIANGGQTNDGLTLVALRALYQHGRHIRNIGLAPGNRVSQVFPLEGNQAVIGLFYPEVPDQWPSVRLAIESKATVVAGPVALHQGGVGLISRTPVFLADGRYWGVVSIVLDLDSLFAAIGLGEELGGVRYTLRQLGERGRPAPPFLGSEPPPEADPVLYNLDIPGGIWQLAAVPARGWGGDDRRLLWWADIGGCLAALLIAAALYHYLRGRRRIAASEKRLRAFLDTTQDGVIVTDAAGIVHEFNPAAERLFGFSAGEIVGSPLHRILPEPKSEADTLERVLAASAGPRNFGAGHLLYGRRKDGREFPVEITVGATLIEGKHLHVGLLRDISERKAFEQRLIDLATTDGLTGALSRRAFIDSLENMVALARRHQRQLSLLMIDVDHFKRINDSYGHHVGDAALIRLSAAMRQCLRASDRFGRFGGEEFIALLPETDGHQAGEVAGRMLAVISASEIPLDGRPPLHLTASIGVASWGDHCTDAESLIRAADHALYQAKAAGRNRWLSATLTPSLAASLAQA